MKDIDALKESWMKDPCWDIEETEGFSDHYAELKIYRLECELKSLRKRQPNAICPLLSLAPGSFVPTSCQGAKCAWWISRRNNDACALTVLANEAAAGSPVE